MKITLFQTDIKWADITANLEILGQTVSQAERSDLYVLPEMFSTGFATKPDGIADTDEGVTLRWMQQKSQEMDAAIAGSVAIKAVDGTYRNRFYFVKPTGETVFYDKRHLFSYGGEDRNYTPGTNRIVVEWRGTRVLLQVCYDLRFPVFSRNSADCGYDLALYVANWPDSRRKVWDALLRARALENQCYVAGVNRVGDDNACHYNGGTALIDAYGREVCAVADDASGCATATLDMERLKAFREKFPVLQDADTFSLEARQP